MRFYLLSVTINSDGKEVRNFTPYDVKDTAIRKFYECFNAVGGGPKKITALLLDDNLNYVKREQWIQEVEEGEES